MNLPRSKNATRARINRGEVSAANVGMRLSPQAIRLAETDRSSREAVARARATLMLASLPRMALAIRIQIKSKKTRKSLIK
jgi:hypothetical protein